MKKITILGFSLLIILMNGYTQGCVAVRNISGFGQYNLLTILFPALTGILVLPAGILNLTRISKEPLQ
ncbi:MAG TPA: hypothetical protein VIS75_08015 [Chitinophagaceae bacterium]